LESESLPDAQTDARVLELLDELAPGFPESSVAANTHSDNAPGRTRYSESTRVEIAPPTYWRRWTQDAAPPERVVATATAATPAPEPVPPLDDAAYFPGAVQLDASALSKVATTASPEPLSRFAAEAAATESTPAAEQETTSPSKRPGQRLYHLTDSSALAVQLDQRLEALGYELELIDSADELREILSALAPDAVIVDAAFKQELESIGTVLRSTRERSGMRVTLLALSDEDSVQIRLAARRAGADALLIKPGGVDEVLGKLHDLLSGESRDRSYRILVVEDDRSQALFAAVAGVAVQIGAGAEGQGRASGGLAAAHEEEDEENGRYDQNNQKNR
jgi:CheY-like chemotaxis protein